MDWTKNLDLDGNKVINVAEPTEQNDVATKIYTDRITLDIHNLTPTSNINEYVRYINLRNMTLHSLAGIMDISTDIPYQKNDIPHALIESSTCTMKLQIDPNNIVGKSIQLEFIQEINVSMLLFNLVIDNSKEWTIHYIWQCSEDGIQWNNASNTINAKTKKQIWCGNNAQLTFINHAVKRSKYWRILFRQSKSGDKTIYLNFLRMNVSV